MVTRRLDLQQIRVRNNITQQRLSELTGYPQSFISQIERGKVSVPMSFIDKVSDILNIKDINKYVSYIYITKPNTSADVSEQAQAPEEKEPTVEADNEPDKPAEKETVDRLVELLEKSERRIERQEKKIEFLEAEIGRLRSELETPLRSK